MESLKPAVALYSTAICACCLLVQKTTVIFAAHLAVAKGMFLPNVKFCNCNIVWVGLKSAKIDLRVVLLKEL